MVVKANSTRGVVLKSKNGRFTVEYKTGSITFTQEQKARETYAALIR